MRRAVVSWLHLTRARGNADKFQKTQSRIERISRYSTTATATTSRKQPLRCAIIGSGPAGFYAAHRLFQKQPDACIDMYEALPTPFGLVRFGVAPDHPEVKNCIDKFNEVAHNPNFTFSGNVQVGNGRWQLPLTCMAPHYDAFLFAYGASQDRKLGIPGEDLKGIHSARGFVGWYNGLPEYAGLQPELDTSERAVIIGQGNVALDVARTLLSPISRLRNTDITEEALNALSKSRIKRVSVVGRRGPLQAPYTIKELRELMKLENVAFHSMDKMILPPGWNKMPRQIYRIAQVLYNGSKTTPDNAFKSWDLEYMLSPTAFLESRSDPSRLGAVSFDETQFSTEWDSVSITDMEGIRGMKVKSVPDGSSQVFDTHLAFRSVGYKSEAIHGFGDVGIPFDTKMGIIPNDLYGRVLSPDRGPGGLTAGHVPGMYCAGWVKRGPTGVIASTMDDAFISAEVIAKDWDDGVPFLGRSGSDGQRRGWEAVKDEVKQRNIRSVSWEDWQRINAVEVERGKAKGKAREKCRTVSEMLKILDG